MRVVITVIGKDRVGIIAMVSGMLAQHQINILNINQNIMDGYFNMVTIADMSNSTLDIQAFQALMTEKGAEYGVEIKVQHEDIFKAMHRI